MVTGVCESGVLLLRVGLCREVDVESWKRGVRNLYTGSGGTMRKRKRSGGGGRELAARGRFYKKSRASGRGDAAREFQIGRAQTNLFACNSQSKHGMVFGGERDLYGGASKREGTVGTCLPSCGRWSM